MSQAAYCLNVPNQGCIAAIANLGMDEASTFTASFFTASERDLALTSLKNKLLGLRPLVFNKKCKGLWLSISSIKLYNSFTL